MLHWVRPPKEAPTSGQPGCGLGNYQPMWQGRINLQDLLPHDDLRHLMKLAEKSAADGVLLFQ